MSTQIKHEGFTKSSDRIEFYLQGNKMYDTDCVAFCYEEDSLDSNQVIMLKHGDRAFIEDYAKEVRHAIEFWNQNEEIKRFLPGLESTIKVLSIQAKDINDSFLETLDRFVFNTGYLGYWLNKERLDCKHVVGTSSSFDSPSM